MRFDVSIQAGGVATAQSVVASSVIFDAATVGALSGTGSITVSSVGDLAASHPSTISFQF